MKKFICNYVPQTFSTKLIGFSLQLAFIMIILHVDDDEEDREIFRRALQEVSPRIECLDAADGLEAFQLLSDAVTLSNLNCMFLDINMPLMDGITLLQRIKKDERLSKIPVYMYSASHNPKELDKIKAFHVEIIAKQSDFKKLARILEPIVKPMIITTSF